jgi:hypothetical protein
MLRLALAFALMPARKLVRGAGTPPLSEEDRYLVADDVVHRLQQHSDPRPPSEELPPITGKGSFDAVNGIKITRRTNSTSAFSLIRRATNRSEPPQRKSASFTRERS